MTILWVRKLTTEKLNNLPKVIQLLCWAENCIQNWNFIWFKKCRRPPFKGINVPVCQLQGLSRWGRHNFYSQHWVEGKNKKGTRRGKTVSWEIGQTRDHEAPGGWSHLVQVEFRVGYEVSGPRRGFPEECWWRDGVRRRKAQPWGRLE